MVPIKFAVPIATLIFRLFTKYKDTYMRYSNISVLNNPASVSLLSGVWKPQIRF